MLARIKRGLPPKYAGTALSMMLWSWIKRKLDSGNFWESWEQWPGLGSGTWNDKKLIDWCHCGLMWSDVGIVISPTSSYLHISDWQPIWVGSLLFFKWTIKCVQNITNLKGTDCVSTNSILWRGKNSIDNFSFLSIIITPLNNRTHRFWKSNFLR